MTGDSHTDCFFFRNNEEKSGVLSSIFSQEARSCYAAEADFATCHQIRFSVSQNARSSSFLWAADFGRRTELDSLLFNSLT